MTAQPMAGPGMAMPGMAPGMAMPGAGPPLQLISMAETQEPGDGQGSQGVRPVHSSKWNSRHTLVKNLHDYCFHSKFL